MLCFSFSLLLYFCIPVFQYFCTSVFLHFRISKSILNERSGGGIPWDKCTVDANLSTKQPVNKILLHFVCSCFTLTLLHCRKLMLEYDDGIDKG